MKKIVCELCEGTVFDKVDGRFVCKGCGTSYSAEEARGMMREVEGEEPVATGASVMPQANPNQQQLDNILMLATNAWSADNNAETENYCNRAIELDASCYKAWMLKGKAIGWSSTIQNPRIAEAAHSFKQAVDFAPDDEKESLTEEAVDELKRLGLACISLRQKRFSDYPDNEELMGFANDIEPLVNGLAILLSKGAEVQGDVLSSLIDALGENIASIKFMGMKSKAEKAGVPKEYFSQIAVMMGNAGIAGFNTASKKYNSDSKPMPNDFIKTMNEVDNCITLLDMANDASDDDDDDDIKRYNSMIKMQEYCINMTAYADYSSYSRGWMLTDESKKTRRKRISGYRDKIKEIEKAAREKAEEEARKAEEEARKAEEEKQARIAAYWEAHADEKAALDSELKELNDKKAAFEKEISDIESQIKAAEPTGKVPSEVEKDKIKDQISDLNNRRAKLGLFAGKEKKQIGEEIASLEGRLSALEGKIEEEKKARKAEADQKCAPLKAKKEELTGQKDAAVKRITAINKELTKDPEE